MQNGYNIFWTDSALKELADTIEYLKENWTDKELKKLALKLDDTLSLLCRNPELFQISHKTGIRRAVVLQYNTMYYRINNNQVEILSFFSNRQNPEKRKL